jgi:hypothetical protein
MNLGALLVWLKLAQDSGFTVSPKTEPTTPTENPQNVSIKPICGPGHYAYKDPLSGLWSCLRIPGGR